MLCLNEWISFCLRQGKHFSRKLIDDQDIIEFWFIENKVAKRFENTVEESIYGKMIRPCPCCCVEDYFKTN